MTMLASNFLNDRIIKVLNDFTDAYFNYPGQIYSRIYPGCIPETYHLRWNDDHNLVCHNLDNYPDDIARTINTDDFDMSAVIRNFKNEPTVCCFPLCGTEFLIFGNPSYCNFLITMGIGKEYTQYDWVSVMSKCFVKMDKKDCTAQFAIAGLINGNLRDSYYDIKCDIDCDIEKNYNDDLPIKKICSIIEKPSHADLMLFYGEPGTGKSTLIKHLIKQYSDRLFIFLDATLLQCIQPAMFISYLTQHNDCVLILEDCERILASRECMNNSMMSTLLNITDGVISDILGIKLICTFNTALSNIDNAILRKGRLSLRYEFKKLCSDKCKALTGDATERTLADIYHTEANTVNVPEKKKIGF